METYDRLTEKWAPVLTKSPAGKITDSHRRAVTAAVLENQENAFAEAIKFDGTVLATLTSALLVLLLVLLVLTGTPF